MSSIRVTIDPQTALREIHGDYVKARLEQKGRIWSRTACYFDNWLLPDHGWQGGKVLRDPGDLCWKLGMLQITGGLPIPSADLSDLAEALGIRILDNVVFYLKRGSTCARK